MSYEKNSKTEDVIAHPSHYCLGGIEPIDYITSNGLDFCIGNVIKYVTRAGHKDPTKTIEDLNKAKQYIDFEIEKVIKKQGDK